MQKPDLNEWTCRWAPSLGELEGSCLTAWGIYSYCGDTMEYRHHLYQPAVFFGLYGLPDFYELWFHKGRRCILWAGTDIIHFKNGYWLEDGGGIKISSKPLATWINKYCESYVENEVEQKALEEIGIKSKIVPSFMGNIYDFPLCYKPSDKVRFYTSVSGDNFKLYGWDKLEELARKNPSVEFHCYGNTKWPWGLPVSENPFTEMGVWKGNIFVHGRVPKEQMNMQIKEMTGALRLTEFDGFSEIIAKSLLWGQWPISLIEYPFTFPPDQIPILSKSQNIDAPNIKGREWLLSVVNKYPWNQKK